MKVIAGLRWPPDRLPQGDITIAIAVAPIASPIIALRARLLETNCRTIDAGCCSDVVTRHATQRYNPSSPASIRYSDQCRCKLVIAPKRSSRRTPVEGSMSVGLITVATCSTSRGAHGNCGIRQARERGRCGACRTHLRQHSKSWTRFRSSSRPRSCCAISSVQSGHLPYWPVCSIRGNARGHLHSMPRGVQEYSNPSLGGFHSTRRADRAKDR